jgi:hypothetical protein
MAELEDELKYTCFDIALTCFVNGNRQQMIKEIKNFPAFFGVVDYLEWVNEDYGPLEALEISLFIHKIIGVK